MKPRLFLLLVLGPILVLAPWSSIGAGGARGTGGEPPLAGPSRLQLRRNHIVRAVERVKDAVVNIHSERTIHGPPSDWTNVQSQPSRINGMGTGIIIDPRGYIVTNHHVVEDVSVIRIRLSDGTTTSAAVIARDRESDLALLKINVGRPLATMPLGTAKDLMLGEDVIAIGNAFGYEHTVSKGIVSAIKRDVRLNKEISYRALIQTDAAINPGNSGGPLININGELVGVNVAIRAGAQGIGFAIPVDAMIESVARMLRQHRLQSAADGMEVQDRLVRTGDGLERQVVLTSIVDSGPAEKAGLEPGDVLLSVAGTPIRCSFDVQRVLLGKRPGEALAVVFERNGKRLSTRIVLGKSNRSAIELVWQRLGIRVAPVPRGEVIQVNQQLNGGVQIVGVRPQSPAARAGLHRGDVLVGLHRWETLSLSDIAYVLGHPDLATFTPLEFYIIRDGQVRRGWFQGID